MEQIIAYISQYGLPVFVLASCIIVLIGILKLCKVFDKIDSKNIKKLIYYILNIVLAFGASAIYFAIFKMSFADYLMFSCTQVGATTTLYAIYENFGIRKLVRMLFDWIIKQTKKNPNYKVIKLLNSMGVTADKIAEIQAIVDTSLEKKEVQETPATTTTTEIIQR